MIDDAPSLTRRAFLRAGLGASATGLAGCGKSNAESSTATPSPQEDDSVFDGVAVEGDFLVVDLAETDDLSAVNLIAPDGTLYRKRSVEPGVRTVRFRLIELELSQSTHYPPGEYELVAVADEVVESRPLELRPELRIRDVTQYRGEDSIDKARLAVVVENTGTAPTWIYDIAYRNAPYREANDRVASSRDIPRLVEPQELGALFVYPGEKKRFVGLEQPLRFMGEETIDCKRSVDLTIILGLGAGTPIEQHLRVTIDGSSIPLGMRRGYSCSGFSVEILDADDGDEGV